MTFPGTGLLQKGLSSCHIRFAGASGFSLVEFMLSSLILVVVAGSIFSILNQVQRAATYQMEVQGVLESARFAVMTLDRTIRQAGNDPLNVGFTGISEMSSIQVRVRSDLTGSAGTGNPPDPDKGDPDGDTMDSGEDVTISYQASARTLNLNGQPFASNISAFAIWYFDKNGTAAISGDQVTRIRVTLTSESPFADPQTGKIFSMNLASDIQLLRPVK
jgi:Tfp pilus assembly protein PilW